ncbi:MAG: hypothetical protein A4E35_01254 [Methanoregula sp. PtaU1.Bin051]|jgi:hypothetical protein|nr:MAG: hypothetical protein A4E35_01254 [Methanoregula sp. PtaU1.Bin051]
MRISNKMLKEHRRYQMTLPGMLKSLWRWVRMGLKRVYLRYV